MQVRPVLIPAEPVGSVNANTTTPAKRRTPDPGFSVHPHLKPDNDPSKGRMLRSTTCIPAGTVILVDSPYAIVPTRTSDAAQVICSNLACSRRVMPDTKTVTCPRKCDRDVIWCDMSCRAADQSRHDYECLWLREKGHTARQTESPYDFATLWHVVRLLAGWSKEVRATGNRCQQTTGEFDSGWAAVLMCCDYLDSWPKSQVEHWERLTRAYMDDKSVLPCPLSADQMLSLICKEETNTFGLYPRATGTPVDDGSVTRGESYGLGLYPRAAMFNHSCQPNVSHKPDGRCRMVYTATRDIPAGEECVITYFDLAAHEDVAGRQKHVQEQFRFRCTCQRCVEDEARENMEGTDALPFCDL